MDANGKYEGSLFLGNEFWLGSNSLCKNIELSRHNLNVNTNSFMHGLQNYRRTFENRLVMDNTQHDVNSIPPYPIQFSVVTLILKMNFLCQFSNLSEAIINIGLCLPRSCSAPDIRATLEWITDKTIIKIAHVKVLNQEYLLWNDPRFYTLCILLFATTILMTLGTILEFIEFKDDSKHKTTTWYRILNAFSVRKNIRSICSLDVGEDTLAPIHGLKFLSMMWVILVHSCLMLFQVAENKKFRDEVENDVLYQTISNGTYAVDTFFTLSGVLVSFLLFRTIAKYPIKKMIGHDGIFGNLYFYVSILLYRLIRLSVPYLVVIIFTSFIMEQKMNTSALHLPSRDHVNCGIYWWRNILYINTFYPVSEMCMIWSWYLSNDTQFYVLGVPILLIALRSRIIALSLALLGLVSSWLTTAIISYQTQHIIDIRDPFANYDELYDKPWTRVGPYLLGMIAGWILFRINCTLKVPRRINYMLWICSIFLMIFVIYGPMYFPSTLSFGIFYSSMSHTLWSLAVSWIIVACVTNNGFWVNNILSWRYMYPLSRISYCAYLVHPLVIRMALLSSDKPFYLTVEIVAVLFFGFLFLTLIFATILSLAFESPIVALLRLGHPGRKRN